MTSNKLTDERIDALIGHVGAFTLERGDDLRDVRTALLELQAYRKAAGKPALRSVVPDGYVMVPAKASIVMIRAGAKAAREYLEEYGGNSPQVIYQAMVATAQQQEVRS